MGPRGSQDVRRGSRGSGFEALGLTKTDRGLDLFAEGRIPGAGARVISSREKCSSISTRRARWPARSSQRCCIPKGSGELSAMTRRRAQHVGSRTRPARGYTVGSRCANSTVRPTSAQLTAWRWDPIPIGYRGGRAACRDPDRAGVGLDQAGQEIQDRGLAAARRAHQAGEAAGLDRERDLVEDVEHAAVAPREALADGEDLEAHVRTRRRGASARAGARWAASPRTRTRTSRP